MLEGIQFIFNFLWQLLSIEIPVSETIRFNFWQYFLFIAIIAITGKQLFRQGGEE